MSHEDVQALNLRKVTLFISGRWHLTFKDPFNFCTKQCGRHQVNNNVVEEIVNMLLSD